MVIIRSKPTIFYFNPQDNERVNISWEFVFAQFESFLPNIDNYKKGGLHL